MIALDTNILVYATSDDADPRHGVAQSLLERLFVVRPVVPVQVLAEFLNVAHKGKLSDPDEATQRVQEWIPLFATPATALDDLTQAHGLARNYRLQFFDALIASVARRAGAATLLSEDMQDGLSIDGMTILNPFIRANQERIDTAIGGLK